MAKILTLAIKVIYFMHKEGKQGIDMIILINRVVKEVMVMLNQAVMENPDFYTYHNLIIYLKEEYIMIINLEVVVNQD